MLPQAIAQHMISMACSASCMKAAAPTDELGPAATAFLVVLLGVLQPARINPDLPCIVSRQPGAHLCAGNSEHVLREARSQRIRQLITRRLSSSSSRWSGAEQGSWRLAGSHSLQQPPVLGGQQA